MDNNPFKHGSQDPDASECLRQLVALGLKLSQSLHPLTIEGLKQAEQKPGGIGEVGIALPLAFIVRNLWFIVHFLEHSTQIPDMPQDVKDQITVATAAIRNLRSQGITLEDLLKGEDVDDDEDGMYT